MKPRAKMKRAALLAESARENNISTAEHSTLASTVNHVVLAPIPLRLPLASRLAPARVLAGVLIPIVGVSSANAQRLAAQGYRFFLIWVGDCLGVAIEDDAILCDADMVHSLYASARNDVERLALQLPGGARQ